MLNQFNADRLMRYYPSWVIRLPIYGLEFLSFGIKEALSCLFAAAFFITLGLSKLLPLGVLPRYDFILLVALMLQALMLFYKLETWQEFKAICLFHLFGLLLEIFKTSPEIGSWSYPEFAYSKVFGVPLYSGFMYAAVASYLLQAWKLFHIYLVNYPHRWLVRLLAVAIYINFFSHHFIGDHRWLLMIFLVMVFWHTRVYFTPLKRRYFLPLPFTFLLIGFFIWIAENIATYLGAWHYPNQMVTWQYVHWGKISSWGLLVVISFVAVAELQLTLNKKRRYFRKER